jgi:hypothetical protein
MTGHRLEDALHCIAMYCIVQYHLTVRISKAVVPWALSKWLLSNNTQPVHRPKHATFHFPFSTLHSLLLKPLVLVSVGPSQPSRAQLRHHMNPGKQAGWAGRPGGMVKSQRSGLRLWWRTSRSQHMGGRGRGGLGGGVPSGGLPRLSFKRT